MSSIQQAQQGPIAGSFKISNNDTSSLEYLIGKRGNVQTELDKIYKPQWYNFYGYGTSLNDANKIKSVQLQTERNNLDEQISSQQWNEQSFMFRSGYRSIQAALLYLAVIGGLYGTQDYWKNLVSIDGTLTFNQLAIIPLMQMLKLILKTNETVLKNFENPAIVEPIKTISEIIQPEA
jgi:hypothetical protein